VSRPNDWHLDNIEIRFNTSSEKYEGKVRFQNGHWEYFSFRIPEGMCEKYIALIADNLVESAQRLGDDLVKSLGLDKREGECTDGGEAEPVH
jgi:hypothetical protein